MRTVVFVKRQELELSGSLSPNALVLGDVDNDSAYELAVGSLDGDLLIFKGEETNPIASASGLGTITCVGIGDICNQGKNSVFTMSAEGYFHVFSVEPYSPKEENVKETTEEEKYDGGDEKTPGHQQESHKLEEIHKQQLSANSKVILLADIDLNNSFELVVGFTDRKVRAYRWQTFVMEKDGEVVTYGKFVMLQMWVLGGQIGSLSLSRHSDNFPKLVVSQPGCNYAELSCDWVTRSKLKETESGVTHVINHPITNKRARNANISTEIIANVSK
ncbi:putative integrin-alpha FG-GAP repeat-containing protein 2-like, partial [Apostichopus japonicus]